MPKSSKIFLAVVFVLGLVLVIGLAFAWLSSSQLRNMTARLPRTVAGKAHLDIENQSNTFQMYVESQDRGERALDLLSNELAVNGINNVKLVLTDELQANKLQYVNHDYYVSESYQVKDGVLTVFLNVNPPEWEYMKTAGWTPMKMSEELEAYFYKGIYLAAKTTRREAGPDDSLTKARELVSKLNREYGEKLLTFF